MFFGCLKMCSMKLLLVLFFVIVVCSMWCCKVRVCYVLWSWLKFLMMLVERFRWMMEVFFVVFGFFSSSFC